MAAVLEKVRQLEQYIQVSNGQADWMLETTLDKLLDRERQKLRQQLTRLKSQATDFETRYGWTSDEFSPRFEHGELGDEMDLIEWSATLKMIANLQHTIATLDAGAVR